MKKNAGSRRSKIDQLAERIRHLQAIYGALRREYYMSIGEKVDAMIDHASLEEIRMVVTKIRAKYFQGINTEALEEANKLIRGEDEENGKEGKNE